MKTFLESFYKTQELLPSTTFNDVLNLKHILVYRSSARPDKSGYESGSHAGTKQQALIRADYMLNDDEQYEKYYLYELVVDIGKVYPTLLEDNGQDHGYDYSLDLSSKCDTAFYKNTGEGDIRNENLSIIIVNPKSVISSKMVGELTKEYLLSIQSKLYENNNNKNSRPLLISTNHSSLQRRRTLCQS